LLQAAVFPHEIIFMPFFVVTSRRECILVPSNPLLKAICTVYANSIMAALNMVRKMAPAFQSVG
jgi:hypothetical protein